MGSLGVATCLLSICFFVFAAAQETAANKSLLATGDSLFALYDYTGSAALYQKACRADSQNFEAFWKAGRSLNFAGELAPKDSQLAIFEQARRLEERALSLDNSSADAHFQLARAIGKVALFKGIFNSVGLAKQVKREADRTLAIDSLHDGAWHILGRWHREVGKKSKIFRGPLGLGEANKKDAVDFMERAVKLKPALINHHLEMGITYYEYEKRDLARAEFEQCLSLPAQGPLDGKYKEEAKKHLARMDKK